MRALRSALLAAALLFPASALLAAEAPAVISAPAAAESLAKGDAILIDVRTPGEWAQTGVAKGAKLIAMQDKDFVSQLDALLGGDKTRPFILVCATGARSAMAAAALKGMGYTGAQNLSEGMLGSGAGPGWISRKLPMESAPKP